jgi:hypothetical protein
MHDATEQVSAADDESPAPIGTLLSIWTARPGSLMP